MPPSVCCILSAVSSTTLLVTLACALLARPPSGTALALPRGAGGSSRRLPVYGSGTLPWSLHHVAYSCSVLLSVSRSSSPNSVRPAGGPPLLVARTIANSVTHRSLGCCFCTQLPPEHSLPGALFHVAWHGTLHTHSILACSQR